MIIGGSGNSKEKKAMQYGGGWAKHAYGDLHPLSNRRQRRTTRIPDEESTPKFSKNKGLYRPTRRHLLQKLEFERKKIAEYEEIGSRRQNQKGFFARFWIDALAWHKERRQRILDQLAKL